ncbi:MAG TPA: histidine--tRNA ligase [Candidatus Aminicenantes bacterium]|nr:histidine--tRNA ligase [Candidatus Aminicenantes bacterium]
MSEDKPEKQSVSAIKGTHDILPKEARDWQKVEAVVQAAFELYGYREIRTPVFEATELFEKGTGQSTDIVQKEMYTFTDKGGRSITLRPEYTPSVVRAIIEHRLDLLPDPMRYYFIGPMFRFDKPQKGRFRQFHQVDIEVFGENDPAIDAEIIEMADHLLKKLKVTETEVLVNSVGCRNCRPAYLKDLRAAAAAVEASLCPDCQRKAETNPLRIFDCKVEACREIARGFPEISGYLDAECAEHFRKFRSYLDFYGIPHRIEPRLVRGIDYYTKTTFEITAAKLGAQNSILGGGRYDDMMKDFGGPDICAIGFAMGVERLLSVAELEPASDKFIYLAYMGDEAKKEAILLARFLRSHGVECLLEFKERGLKSQLGRASKLGASWALIIGEEEVGMGRYQLKDMEKGTQVEAGKQDLLGILGRSDT